MHHLRIVAEYHPLPAGRKQGITTGNPLSIYLTGNEGLLTVGVESDINPIIRIDTGECPVEINSAVDNS